MNLIVNQINYELIKEDLIYSTRNEGKSVD